MLGSSTVGDPITPTLQKSRGPLAKFVASVTKNALCSLKPTPLEYPRPQHFKGVESGKPQEKHRDRLRGLYSGTRPLWIPYKNTSQGSTSVKQVSTRDPGPSKLKMPGVSNNAEPEQHNERKRRGEDMVSRSINNYGQPKAPPGSRLVKRKCTEHHVFKNTKDASYLLVKPDHEVPLFYKDEAAKFSASRKEFEKMLFSAYAQREARVDEDMSFIAYPLDDPRRKARYHLYHHRADKGPEEHQVYSSVTTEESSDDEEEEDFPDNSLQEEDMSSQVFFDEENEPEEFLDSNYIPPGATNEDVVLICAWRLSKSPNEAVARENMIIYQRTLRRLYKRNVEKWEEECRARGQDPKFILRVTRIPSKNNMLYPVGPLPVIPMLPFPLGPRLAPPGAEKYFSFVKAAGNTQKEQRKLLPANVSAQEKQRNHQEGLSKKETPGVSSSAIHLGRRESRSPKIGLDPREQKESDIQFKQGTHAEKNSQTILGKRSTSPKALYQHTHDISHNEPQEQLASRSQRQPGQVWFSPGAQSQEKHTGHPPGRHAYNRSVRAHEKRTPQDTLAYNTAAEAFSRTRLSGASLIQPQSDEISAVLAAHAPMQGIMPQIQQAQTPSAGTRKTANFSMALTSPAPGTLPSVYTPKAMPTERISFAFDPKTKKLKTLNTAPTPGSQQLEHIASRPTVQQNAKDARDTGPKPMPSLPASSMSSTSAPDQTTQHHIQARGQGTMVPVFVPGYGLTSVPSGQGQGTPHIPHARVQTSQHSSDMPRYEARNAQGKPYVKDAEERKPVHGSYQSGTLAPRTPSANPIKSAGIALHEPARTRAPPSYNGWLVQARELTLRKKLLEESTPDVQAQLLLELALLKKGILTDVLHSKKISSEDRVKLATLEPMLNVLGQVDTSYTTDRTLTVPAPPITPTSSEGGNLRGPPVEYLRSLPPHPGKRSNEMADRCTQKGQPHGGQSLIQADGNKRIRVLGLPVFKMGKMNISEMWMLAFQNRILHLARKYYQELQDSGIRIAVPQIKPRRPRFPIKRKAQRSRLRYSINFEDDDSSDEKEPKNVKGKEALDTEINKTASCTVSV